MNTQLLDLFLVFLSFCNQFSWLAVNTASTSIKRLYQAINVKREWSFVPFCNPYQVVFNCTYRLDHNIHYFQPMSVDRPLLWPGYTSLTISTELMKQINHQLWTNQWFRYSTLLPHPISIPHLYERWLYLSSRLFIYIHMKICIQNIWGFSYYFTHVFLINWWFNHSSSPLITFTFSILFSFFILLWFHQVIMLDFLLLHSTCCLNF